MSMTEHLPGPGGAPATHERPQQPAQAAGVPAAPRRRTYVLVHGGFHGGWCWRAVSDMLRDRGHAVYTPTQTGCGERAHLLSASITLDTFVDDIANVLLWEDLHDVVLVGHSFGGSAISGVADRLPERIGLLVYLDAVVLQNGQTMFDLLEPDVIARRMRSAQDHGGVAIGPPPTAIFGISDPAQAQYVRDHLTPHPLGTFTSPLRLSHPVTNGRPAVYVHCTEPLYAGVQGSRDWVKAHGMRSVELRTGHDAMVMAPQLLADLLLALAAD
jgi:pimeloyl-ACP methyl ester carboxylesterase